MDDATRELIIRRRRQMMVHSYLYYWMDMPIISDELWQTWANELRDLQAAHPEPVDFYDHEFADWDGSTGMHLPRELWVRYAASLLLKET